MILGDKLSDCYIPLGLIERIKTQLALKSKLENLMINYKHRFDKNKAERKLSIVIGLTSSVVEILENNVEVIHICSEPLFEYYSNLFWRSIKIKKFNYHIYFYKCTKLGKSLNFGVRENMLKKYC